MTTVSTEVSAEVTALEKEKECFKVLEWSLEQFVYGRVSEGSVGAESMAS